MALQTVNQIGSYGFISLSPVPPVRKRRTFVESRAGVDGFAIWYEATRGEIWTPRSFVDVESFILAQGIKNQYEGIVGTVVSVTYEDLLYPDMLVKDVQVRLRSQLHGIGGTAASPKALVVADWTLIIQ